LNGTTIITGTDSTYTGTRYGLWFNANNAGNFDNFSHTSATS
jgi:hypothetical protein